MEPRMVTNLQAVQDPGDPEREDDHHVPAAEGQPVQPPLALLGGLEIPRATFRSVLLCPKIDLIYAVFGVFRALIFLYRSALFYPYCCHSLLRFSFYLETRLPKLFCLRFSSPGLTESTAKLHRIAVA